jgi:hypothetical protein
MIRLRRWGSRAFFRQKSKGNITSLVQALLSNALCWPSEGWSKASGRATFGLDQIRTRLHVDPDSTSVHQVRYIKPRQHPSIGYIDNRNHRLINIFGRLCNSHCALRWHLSAPILNAPYSAWRWARVVERRPGGSTAHQLPGLTPIVAWRC